MHDPVEFGGGSGDASGRMGISSERTASWRLSPVPVLLLLAPIVSEVLLGTTRVTVLFVLLPQIGTWGCATLLIRDVARRRRLGAFAVFLLGLALALAEECVIQQTSLAPLVGVDPARIYGRSLGVNWVYLLWAIGYESIWVVIIPIQLAELVFPRLRHDAWLKTRGVVIASCVFLFASFVAWYMWTQIYGPRAFPELAYRVPRTSIAIGLSLTASLAGIAIGLRPRLGGVTAESASVPPRPALFAIALLGGLFWFSLLFLAYGALPTLPPAIPLAAGVTLAIAGVLLVVRWASSRHWRDSHGLALSAGALAVSMTAGFPILVASRAPAIDIVGKAVFNIIAVLLLIALSRKVAARERGEAPQAKAAA